MDSIDMSLPDKVGEFVSVVFGGVHRLKRLENKGHYYEAFPHGTLATFDDDKLTLIVIMAHELGLRAEVCTNGMHGLKIMLHSRKSRTGRLFERHPTIYEVLKDYAQPFTSAT